MAWRDRLALGLLAGGLGLMAGGAAAEEAVAVKHPTTLAAGASFTSGNTDTSLYNVSLLTEHKAETQEFRAGAEGSYGKTDSDTTTENAKGFATYRRFLSERTYGVFDGTLSYDSIAGVDYRLILSPGIGHYLVKAEKTQFLVEIGPAYIREKVGGDENEIWAFRLAERLDHTLSPTAKFWQSAEYLPEMSDVESYLLNAELGVDAALNASMSLRIVLQDTYDSTPAAGRKENDLKIIGSLVYKL